MAKKRVLAVVGVKPRKGELVYYKDGKLYAVEAKRGGTKGARKCTAKKTAKKSTRKAAPRKAAKKTAPRKTARKVVKKKR